MVPRPRIRLFLAYARKNQKALKRLCGCLEVLVRSGEVEIFYDQRAAAGVRWEREILDELQRADIIVLLGSPQFMSSKYCLREMAVAMRRFKAGRVRLVPVLVQPFAKWTDTPFGEVNSLPAHGRALSQSRKADRAAAYYQVANGIADVVASMRAERVAANARLTSQLPRPAQNDLSRVLRCDLPSDERRELSRAMAVSALSTREPAILAKARATLSGMCGNEQADDDDWQVVRLCALLGAFENALLGEGIQAAQSIVLMQPYDADAIELWRHEVRLEVASHIGVEALAQAVVSVKAWFDGGPDVDIRRACYHRAKGRLAYRVGAFREAVQHFECAFCEALCHCDTIVGWLHLASAWLEVGELVEAHCAASQAQAHAKQSGLPSFELRAALLLRIVAVRGGEKLTPNTTGIVELAEQVGVPGYCGVALLVEAVVAWRCGMRLDALQYACRATTLLDGVGMARMHMLAQALAVACGERVPLPEFERRVRAAVGCESGEVGLQALALLLSAPEHGLSVHPDLLSAMNLDDSVERLISATDASRWGRRLDVMSLDEACLCLGAGGGFAVRQNSDGFCRGIQL